MRMHGLSNSPMHIRTWAAAAATTTTAAAAAARTVAINYKLACKEISVTGKIKYAASYKLILSYMGQDVVPYAYGCPI